MKLSLENGTESGRGRRAKKESVLCIIRELFVEWFQKRIRELFLE